MRFEGGCNWCKAMTVSSEGMDRVMGWKTLVASLYSLTLPKVRHR
jgi:hypothetical protein